MPRRETGGSTPGSPSGTRSTSPGWRRPGRFETVVDCATFHVFGDAERDRYVAGLGRVLDPGGAFFVLGDARSDPRTIYGVSPGELRTRFAETDGWSVEFVVETRFERRYSVNRAYLAGIRRR